MFLGSFNFSQTQHFWVCILFIALHGVHVKSTNRTGNHVAWVDTHKDAETIPEPAGLFDGVFTYLCKAKLPSGRWIPGALIDANDSQRYCHITHYRAREFQMLHVPRSTISWIPYNGTLPISPIYAGRDGHSRPTYPCRVWIGSNLYIGHFGEGGRKCFYAQGDFEESSTASGIEILAVNAFARAFFSQIYSWNDFADSDP